MRQRLPDGTEMTASEVARIRREWQKLNSGSDDMRQSNQTVINLRGGGFPHLLHFVLTLLTLGLWLPIWILHRLFSSR